MTTDPEPQHDALDLSAVREAFEASTDFTVGIEEEFAIVDPAILDLEHRFEEMQAACLRDPELVHAVKGELIDTEIEIRSGRGETFADAAQEVADRLVRSGVKIIFNYSERLLQVPPDVTVHTSSPAVDLLYALYFYLT